LAEVERKKTSRAVFLSLIIILAIGFVAVKFGLELLVKMAIFLSPKNQPVVQEQKRLLPAPVINSTPSATNSAQIKISGYASSMANVSLTVNGEVNDSLVADADGYFESEIKLEKGENFVSVKYTDTSANESRESQSISIIRDDESPELTIDSPANAAILHGQDQKTAEIKGKTEPDTSLTVNNRYVSVQADGSFSYKLGLQEGDNEITITAKDKAGNLTEKKLTLRWQP
jgi:bacillopeptidase F